MSEILPCGCSLYSIPVSGDHGASSVLFHMNCFESEPLKKTPETWKTVLTMPSPAVSDCWEPILFAVQDIVFQLQKFVSAMSKYHTDCDEAMAAAVVFPIEVDLTRGTFTYNTTGQFNDDQDEEEEDEEGGGGGEAGTNSVAVIGDLLISTE